VVLPDGYDETTKAGPYGMTNKEGNCKSKDEIQGSLHCGGKSDCKRTSAAIKAARQNRTFTARLKPFP
jgi:hypothetical protein